MCKWYACLLLVVTSSYVVAQANSDEFRDPTTPLGFSGPASGDGKRQELVLDSVLYSAQRKLAIINGNSVREGQQIPASGGVKVQRILPQKVLLQQGDKTWSISLSPTVVNRR